MSEAALTEERRMRRMMISLFSIVICVTVGATAFAEGTGELRLIEAEARTEEVTIVVRLASSSPGGRILIEDLLKKKAEQPSLAQYFSDPELRAIANVQVFGYSRTTVDRAFKGWDNVTIAERTEVLSFPKSSPMKIFVTSNNGGRPKGSVTILYPSPDKSGGWERVTISERTQFDLDSKDTFIGSLKVNGPTAILTVYRWPGGDPMIFDGP